LWNDLPGMIKMFVIIISLQLRHFHPHSTGYPISKIIQVLVFIIKLILFPSSFKDGLWAIGWVDIGVVTKGVPVGIYFLSLAKGTVLFWCCNVKPRIQYGIVQCCKSGPFWLDPDVWDRIRIRGLKGQPREKVAEIRVWDVSLDPN
jgi:hypothetical protein